MLEIPQETLYKTIFFQVLTSKYTCGIFPVVLARLAWYYNNIFSDNTDYTKAMAELFGVQAPAISKHFKNIFEQGELREEVVVSKMEIPTPHGAIPEKTQLSPANYYNLGAIISMGYIVNSIHATRFRIWATGILKEYMIKGFAVHIV